MGAAEAEGRVRILLGEGGREGMMNDEDESLTEGVISVDRTSFAGGRRRQPTALRTFTAHVSQRHVEMKAEGANDERGRRPWKRTVDFLCGAT